MRNKVALVTGGNSGIGRGIAHRFAREGAAVVIAGRDPAKGATVLAELKALGVEAAFLAVDLADEAAVKMLIGETEARFGRLDVVVNNAGLGSRRGGVEDADGPGERWRKMRGPNLDSGYFVSAHALPAMERSGGGAIVNISSTATLHGNWGLYCIAKAAVEGMTRAFAAEAAPMGIRVNCISPGWIATDMELDLSASGNEDGEWDLPPSLLGRIGTPNEIAAAVYFLASGEASFITGQTLIVDGGMSVIDYPSRTMLDQVGHRLQSRPRDN
jgi:NAD(P)-dependent dehydrogenase (short-subunit alcohol dehydrogenase family)